MTYLIMGASSDIGIAYIKYLDRMAAGNEEITIIAHYNRSEDKLSKLTLNKVKLLKVQADLSKADATNKIELFLKQQNLSVSHFLFLPAQKFEYCRLKEYLTEKNQEYMDVQVYSFMNICKFLLPEMKKVKYGRVLVMLTYYVEEELPPKYMSPYLITKYALLGAMKSMASEYGGDNIKINGISPDMVDTAFLDNIDERIKEMTAYNNCNGRLIVAEDLAPFINKYLREDTVLNGYNEIVTPELVC